MPLSPTTPAASTHPPSSTSSSPSSTIGRSSTLPLPYSGVPSVPAAKAAIRGPNRTSKTANKLKVLPTSSTNDPDADDTPGAEGKKRSTSGGKDDDDDEEDEGVNGGEGVHYYTALSQIPAGSARRDAIRLTKTEKAKLPRVTAYCTAAGFNLEALSSYFSSRPSSYRCHPRLFDTECLHTPYLPPAPSSTVSNSPVIAAKSQRNGQSSSEGGSGRKNSVNVVEGDLLNLGDSATSAADPGEGEDKVGEGNHHAEGIDESEQLLYTKREHQEENRRRLSQTQSYQDSERERERLRRTAQELNDREVQLRRKKLLQKNNDGFTTRPSKLNAGPPRRRRSRSGSGSGIGYATESDREDDDDEEEWVPDVFVFEYGTVVIWGMTEREEKRVLANLRRFEIEKLSVEDIEMEDLNFYYANYSRIYNDVITLRKGSSFMTKLSLSHALSQSVKISLFEELISATIDQTKDLPKSLSETGKIGMPRKEIMKQIGSLFILRINWGGSILETPEFFWSYPDLEPLYQAARSYLEIGQRIELLNARVEVLQDMLTLLKESVNSSHGERLETIVIVLIGVEIILGIMTILVDVVSGA